jgi:sulfite dehydrogenase
MVQISGLAFGGVHAVERVEVSTDGGKTWQPARFVGPDLGRYAWRPFVLAARLQPGTYTLASRATDAKGTVQDENRIENTSGYVNSSWRDHALQVTVG